MNDLAIAPADGTTVTIDDVKAALNVSLGGLIKDGIILDDASANGSEVRFALSLAGSESGAADLDLVLGSNDPMIEPLLGIVDEVNISLDWEFDIAFGVFEISDTMESILFVDTSATNELTIDNLRVDLTGGADGTFAAKGKAGVFGALFRQDEGLHRQEAGRYGGAGQTREETDRSEKE